MTDQENDREPNSGPGRETILATALWAIGELAADPGNDSPTDILKECQRIAADALARTWLAGPLGTAADDDTDYGK